MMKLKYILTVCLALLMAAPAFPQGTVTRKQQQVTPKPKPKPKPVTPKPVTPKPATQKKEALVISNVTFQNVDSQGDLINEAPIYLEDAQYIRPKFTYSGLNSSQNKTVYVKYLKPDGSLMTGSSSPSGYTWKEEETFNPGSYTKYLLGWGSTSGMSFDPGTYTCEIWIDGRCVSRTNFSPRFRDSFLDAYDVKFANVDNSGNIIDDFDQPLIASQLKYVKPKIYYRGLNDKMSRTVYVKYFKPDGSLMTGASSPSGYTWKEDIGFLPGFYNQRLLGWGNSSGGTYQKGTYTCEVWVEGRCVSRSYFDVK